MGKIYSVSNVEEAVELAYKFKQDGKYNWFRGQVKDWPPYSSLYRRRQDEAGFEDANFRYRLFQHWIRNIEELKHLLYPENADELEAIMQHYGIPTNYIDFTSDPGVAGFFAADTSTPPTEGNSCIYCLDVDDLLSVFKTVKDCIPERKDCFIRKVVIDVSNLWRLQAQHGIFLYADYNWDVDYDLDKIVFPYTKYPSYPTKEIIYPGHKSSLELLLDQFQDRLRTTLFYREFNNVTKFNAEWEAFPDGVFYDAFKNPEDLKEHISWNQAALKQWYSYKIEDFHETVGITQQLNLQNLASPDDIRKNTRFGILQLLRSNPKIRSKTIDWKFIGVDEGLNETKIAELLSRVWNGMRSLPFTDEDISLACGNTLYLYAKFMKADSSASDSQIFREAFGDCMRVGFSYGDKSGSYGYASFSSITNSYGINVPAMLKEEHIDRAENPFNCFMIIYNPKILFEFTKFKNFFATEVIPSQVVAQRALILYNPAKLITFGIP